MLNLNYIDIDFKKEYDIFCFEKLRCRLKNITFTYILCCISFYLIISIEEVVPMNTLMVQIGESLSHISDNVLFPCEHRVVF
jgi:hypothetical protein